MTPQSIIDNAQRIIDTTVALNDEHNKTIDELNEAIEKIESLEDALAKVTLLADERWDLLQKQNQVIKLAQSATTADRSQIDQLTRIAAGLEVKLSTANNKLIKVEAELKELKRLDPKRIQKQNKNLKAKNAELVDTNKALTAKNNEMKKATKEAATKMVKQGAAPFFMDPDTKNALRIVPDTFVSEDNTYGGVPNTPVIEFLHHKSGITRQGVLCTDGKIGWASAKNSTAGEDIGLIAKNFILDYVKSHKINIKRHMKEAA